MVDMDLLAAKAAGLIKPVSTEPDQIAVEGVDTGISCQFGPVQRDAVLKILVLQELLALKNHRNAGRGKHYCGPECRAFAREPATGISWPDFLRDPCMAVGHLVVRLRVDDPPRRVRVVAMKKGRAHGAQIAVSVIGGNDGVADGMDERRVPLRAEAGTAGTGIAGDPVVVLEILGHGYFPRLLRADIVVDPL